jgi:hypothetical protein
VFPETVGGTKRFSCAGIAVIQGARRKVKLLSHSLEDFGNRNLVQRAYQLKPASRSPGRADEARLPEPEKNLFQEFRRYIFQFGECSNGNRFFFTLQREL